MEELESLFLTDLLGSKKAFPPKGSDRFMGLNPSKASISITQISKACHEHPFECCLLTVVDFSSLFIISISSPRPFVLSLFIPHSAFCIPHSSSPPAFCLLPTASFTIFFSHALLAKMGLSVLGTIPSLFSQIV